MLFIFIRVRALTFRFSLRTDHLYRKIKCAAFSIKHDKQQHLTRETSIKTCPGLHLPSFDISSLTINLMQSSCRNEFSSNCPTLRSSPGSSGFPGSVLPEEKPASRPGSRGFLIFGRCEAPRHVLASWGDGTVIQPPSGAHLPTRICCTRV